MSYEGYLIYNFSIEIYLCLTLAIGHQEPGNSLNNLIHSLHGEQPLIHAEFLKVDCKCLN